MYWLRTLRHDSCPFWHSLEYVLMCTYVMYLHNWTQSPLSVCTPYVLFISVNRLVRNFIVSRDEICHANCVVEKHTSSTVIRTSNTAFNGLSAGRSYIESRILLCSFCTYVRSVSMSLSLCVAWCVCLFVTDQKQNLFSSWLTTENFPSHLHLASLEDIQ